MLLKCSSCAWSKNGWSKSVDWHFQIRFSLFSFVILYDDCWLEFIHKHRLLTLMQVWFAVFRAFCCTYFKREYSTWSLCCLSVCWSVHPCSTSKAAGTETPAIRAILPARIYSIRRTDSNRHKKGFKASQELYHWPRFWTVRVRITLCYINP